MSFFKNKENGFIGIAVLVFLFIALWLVWPTKFLPKGGNSFLQKNCPTLPPPTENPLPDMPALEKRDAPNTTFVPSRVNIPINKNFYTKDGHYKKKQQVTIEGKIFDVYYPEFAGPGEISFHRPIVSRYRHPGKTIKVSGGWQLYLSDFKIIMLVELGPDGKPIVSQGNDDFGKPATFWLTRMYQQQDELLGNPAKAPPLNEPNPLPSDAFACLSTTDIKTNFTEDDVEIPTPEATGSGKQLQLQHFFFRAAIPDGWSTHCKPAIYLYPEKEQFINVKVYTKGQLTYTDPEYPLLGWTTLASPDGNLTVDGKQYDYLYYESKIPDPLIQKPTNGYVVQFSELPNLFSSLLPKLGLNEKQTFDFKEYWEKTLPDSPYYFVGIMEESNLDEIEPLVITPQPKTSIRVRLYFEALSEKKTVKEPTIVTPEKNGFTMVEWGGMVKRDKDHPFTCSQ